MAVVTMCSADTPGAVRSDYWSKEGRDIYLVTEHVGMVVEVVPGKVTYSHGDADDVATVYDPATDTFREVMYASTRGWSYPNHAAVDATPEVKARWEAKLASDREAARAAHEAREAATPYKGKRVRFVKAKRANKAKGEATVPAGTEGEVFWYGEDNFARSYSYFGRPMRVGVATDDGRKVFVGAGSVEVIAA